jgi:hypothetical protein
VLSLDRENAIPGAEVFEKVKDAEEGHAEIGTEEKAGSGRDWDKGTLVVQLGRK